MRNIKKHLPSSWNDSKERVQSIYKQDLLKGLNMIPYLTQILEKVNFDSIKNGIYSQFGYSGHYGTPDYAYNYLYYSNQLNKAWFDYNMNDGKPVKLHIADKIVETTGKFNQTRSIGAIGVANSIRLAF